jgi:hypothetical protein
MIKLGLITIGKTKWDDDGCEFLSTCAWRFGVYGLIKLKPLGQDKLFTWLRLKNIWAYFILRLLSSF